MRLWLLINSEPVPSDPGDPKLQRMGRIADEAARRGHEVVFWTSTFDHGFKKHRTARDNDVHIGKNYLIKLLHSPGYRRNVSVWRVVDHYILAKKFKKIAVGMSPPDVILAAMPTIELSLAATEYGIRMNVPVVLDMRDMWPDIFLEEAPRWLRPICRVALSPMFTNLRIACRNAAAIFGITEGYLEWGLKYAGRDKGPYDRVFFHAYNSLAPSPEGFAKAEAFWNGHGIARNGHQFIVCFFGTFGRQFDMETVFRAARVLTETKPNIIFVLCGHGDSWADFRRQLTDLENVIMPGFIGQDQIWTLMEMAKVGLAPYRNVPNFLSNFPMKVSEYLSAGLTIVSALRGSLERLLAENACGVTYAEGDPLALADILSGLDDDRERTEKMSANANNLFEQKFVAEKVYGEMIEDLERLSQGYSRQEHA